MEHLKIGIVEDEMIIAEIIAVALQEIGYSTIEPVRSYQEAIKMIESESPDLLVIDIVLEGSLDGIALGLTINREYGIPFIFLTANSDGATVNRAKDAKPYAYLVKPFSKKDLFSAIEIAFSNYNQQINSSQSLPKPETPQKDAVFVKEGDLFHKVLINDILYVQVENVYLTLYTDKRKYTIRSKLDGFISEYGKDNFLRVHRSYGLNTNHLQTINTLSVKVGGVEIPIQKQYKDQLLRTMRLLK
jgi:DNA-binding LytR/AlgR family response regulator